MRKAINAISGLGSAAIGLIIFVTLAELGWVLYMLVGKGAKMDVHTAGIVGVIISVPLAFVKELNKRFPRTESKHDMDSD